MLDTIYLIQHSHTDLGFTGDQPVIESLHGRFLRQALDYVERFADAPPGERFCWTVETCGFLENWLPRQSARTLERLRRAEAAGLIEICALPDHTTPLSDLADYHASLRLAEKLRRDHGFRIGAAMNCDVNGQNWPFADALLDAGIAGYTTAINIHSGRTPLVRPVAFRWRTPSGRLLPVYHGPAYGYTGRMGISPGADLAMLRDQWLPRMERHLADNGYALPCLLLQSIHPFGDNGPADPDLLEYVRRWNATGHRLRLHLGTPRDWWQAVQPHLDKLPVHAGDWTDSWVYGAGAAARELAYQRATRPRLRAAGALLVAARAVAATEPVAVAQSSALTVTETASAPVRADIPTLAPAAPGGYVGSPASRVAPLDPTDLAEAVLALHAATTAQLRYQEHTWTADCACEHPHGDDAFTQSAHKRALAATARSLATLAHRDALATLARHVTRLAPDELLVFNPLPFARTLTGLVGGSHAFPRGRRDDPTAGRHYQDRKLDYPLLELADRPLNEWKQNPEFWLRPVEVPALGYRVVPRAEACVDPFAGATDSADAVVETPRFRLTFDLVRGGLASLIHAGRELVDASGPYPFGGYVHERVTPPAATAHPRRTLYEMDWSSLELEPPLGWKPGYAAERLGPTRVLSHRVRRSVLGTIIVQTLEAPGAVGAVEQYVWLPAHADWIEFTTRWVAPSDVAPQANYVVFPLALPGAVPRYDIGSQAVRPGADQLPGVGCDYFCAQNWVDFSTADFGVTFALPENPLFMLGGFHFARCATAHPADAAPNLVGFVANNFWETNYPVVQPGEIVAHYRLRAHAGGFDETAAHRFGLDAAYRQPALQHFGERPADGATWPSVGSLLELTASDGRPTPVEVLAFEPRDDGTAELSLHNASDAPAGLRLRSGLLKLAGAEPLASTDAGTVITATEGFTLTLFSRRTLVIRLRFAS